MEGWTGEWQRSGGPAQHRSRPGRLVIAVVGVGLALGLIFLLQGLWRGFQAQTSAYEDNVVLDLHGRKQFAFLIASEPGGFGAPWRLSEDPQVAAGDEVVHRRRDLDL
jgi:hypothetical protein